jgi:uncharacterized membrane protein YccF (DUF307 family)
MSQTVYLKENTGPGCLIRALYFLVIGISLGAAWTLIGWFLTVTIIGMPLGLWMINRLPQVMTLKPPRTSAKLTNINGQWVVTQSADQAPFLIRALYFVLVGWWLSLIWLILAWVIATLTLGFGLPIAFWMFDQVPAITTLSRN